MEKNHLDQVMMKSGLRKNYQKAAEQIHMVSNFILINDALEEHQLGNRIMNIPHRGSGFMVLKVCSKLKFFAPMAAVAQDGSLVLQLPRYRIFKYLLWFSRLDFSHATLCRQVEQTDCNINYGIDTRFLLQKLRVHFEQDPYPSRATKENLAQELGLTFNQVLTSAILHLFFLPQEFLLCSCWSCSYISTALIEFPLTGLQMVLQYSSLFKGCFCQKRKTSGQPYQ